MTMREKIIDSATEIFTTMVMMDMTMIIVMKRIGWQEHLA